MTEKLPKGVLCSVLTILISTTFDAVASPFLASHCCAEQEMPLLSPISEPVASAKLLLSGQTQVPTLFFFQFVVPCLFHAQSLGSLLAADVCVIGPVVIIMGLTN